MDTPKITLAIFGNQNSNSGFQPLYWINSPAQQLENLVPPGMEENPYFFVIETGPLFTQFTLIQNHVSSYMSSRPGVLKMAIGIPKGYRLANGVSPMDVLLGVRKIFIDTCMTQKSALTESYNFNDKLVEPDQLISYIDSFELQPAISQHREMTGTEDALMLLDKDTTASLFKDVQYQEFTNYRRIIVAEKGNASTYKTQLTGLEIPRKPQLKLNINGQPVAWPVVNYYEDTTNVELSLNKRCWEYTPVSFNVNDLLGHEINDPGAGVHVYVDNASETVVCNITPRKKRKTIKIIVNGCDDAKDFTPLLTILVGPKRRLERVAADGTITLEGNDILYFYTKELKAQYQGKDYVITRQTLADDSLTIDVEPHKVSQPLSIPQQNTVQTQSATQATIQATKPSVDNKDSKAMIYRKRIIVSLIAFLCFALGIWLLISLLSKDNEFEEDMTGTSGDNDTEMREMFDDDDDADEIESVMSLFNENREIYEKLLHSPDLTFKQVDEMAEWIKDENVAKRCKEEAPELANTIRNYKKIVSAIRDGQLDNAIKINEESDNALNVVHLWQLNAAYKGWIDNNGVIHPYQKESAEKARKQFSEKYQTFKSFKDIDLLHEDKIEDRTSPFFGRVLTEWPGAVAPTPQTEDQQRRQDQRLQENQQRRQNQQQRGNPANQRNDDNNTNAEKSSDGMIEL